MCSSDLEDLTLVGSPPDGGQFEPSRIVSSELTRVCSPDCHSSVPRTYQRQRENQPAKLQNLPASSSELSRENGAFESRRHIRPMRKGA